MKGRFPLIIVSFAVLFTAGCTEYQTPYISLDLRSVYYVPDIRVNYSYVCEEDEQRCIYKLYNKAAVANALISEDKILPHSGAIEFKNLAEGDYRLFFQVYSQKDGTYYLLPFLDESYDFSVDLP